MGNRRHYCGPKVLVRVQMAETAVIAALASYEKKTDYYGGYQVQLPEADRRAVPR